jgi:hypothetical protein
VFVSAHGGSAMQIYVILLVKSLSLFSAYVDPLGTQSDEAQKLAHELVCIAKQSLLF